MAGPLHDLMQLSGKADVRINCRDCHHLTTVTIGKVLQLFRRRQWRTDWREAHTRFRCSQCDSKRIGIEPDFYEYELRRQRERKAGALQAVPAVLKPGLRPPPPGVSVEEWNGASERERKRLVDRARS